MSFMRSVHMTTRGDHQSSPEGCGQNVRHHVWVVPLRNGQAFSSPSLPWRVAEPKIRGAQVSITQDQKCHTALRKAMPESYVLQQLAFPSTRTKISWANRETVMSQA